MSKNKSKWPKFKHKKEEKTIIGRLTVNARGFGFVEPEIKNSDEDVDIFIPMSQMNDAMHGDKVRVRIIPPYDYYEQFIHKNCEGEIIEIIERANKKIVGTYRIENLRSFVEADDMRIIQRIYIKNSADFAELKNGMKVVVEITDYPKGFRPMSGIISEILGMRKEAGVDILSIIRKYNINEKFPIEVQSEAEQIEIEPSTDEIQKRVDRRDLKIVTIDGIDAKDLDDGVYAYKTDNDNYFLGVYIADVSYYVRENSPLDIEALERGTSIYLVDRVIPMLPKELSNGICSLNAGVNRLAMACEMNLDHSGYVKSYKIFPTVINVYKRLNYDAVNKYFDKGEDENLNDVASMLEILKDICNLRKGIRKNRGSIDFDLPEIKVILNDKGRPVELQKRERNLAESIIEECMLVANETVAKHMYDKNRPFIYRVHGQPEDEKIDKFNELLATFGLHINKQVGGKIKPIDIQHVLNKIQGKHEEKIISTIALRSMQQAYYSVDNIGHFGLAAKYYTHFTSPIRRYPDLIVHRLLNEMIKGNQSHGKQNAKLIKKLPKIASISSTNERVAIDIERETTELKIVEYMKKFVGNTFYGIIISVTKFGFFVELDNGVDGLVHIASLTDDYFDYIESEYAIIGRRSGKIFKIGDEVKVKLVEADVQLRQITFIFIKKLVQPENIIVD